MQLAQDQPPRSADGPLPPAGYCWAQAVSGCRQDTRTRSPPRSLDHIRRPVTSLVEQQEQPGHLIVVGRDHSGSQHRLRPCRSTAPAWSG
jgi:hypothetical protein